MRALPDPPYATGSIRTPHGTIRTPALIPVVATSYGIWDLWIDGTYTAPWDLAQATILSLYHVLQYSRAQQVRTRGIHDVLGTSRPVLMDSGGFQYMKKGTELDPMDVLSFERQSGCDIGITFDYPITPDLDDTRRTVRLDQSIEAANLMLEHADGMELYGAIHGSSPREIETYAERLDKGFSGYGIGSLVPRKGHYTHLVDILYTARALTTLPIHAFGITGFPALYALSYLGVDTFDSWTYVVAAAYKEYIDPERLTRVKNLKEQTSLPSCDCPVCQEHGLKDFIEPTSEGEVLLSLHNLHVFLSEMASIREAIEQNELEAYILSKGEHGNRNINRAFQAAQKKVREKGISKDR